MGSWVMGIVMAVLAILGLLMAANSVDGTMEWVGLLWAIFGTGYCYGLVIRNT